MKVVLAHDYLNQFGGAERFLEVLCELFPEAPIYTLFYDEARTLGRFKGRVIKTSKLNHGIVSKNHRAFIPLLPYVSQHFVLKENYDLVISSTAGYSKGFDLRRAKFHISYNHTPLRYAWEDAEYLQTHPLFRGKPILTKAFQPLINYLQRWDLAASKKPHLLIANSDFIKDKIKKYYLRDAEVISPPVDQKIFYPDKSIKTRDYFLAVGRFLHYKKFDLVISAFNNLNLPLKVVGSGPETARLIKLIRSPHIELIKFGGGDGELRKLYSGAKALIFPQVEDFGLVAVEAIACGTPVIAYRGGGAREIVEEEKSGIFFNHQSIDDLESAVMRFNKMIFKPAAVARTVKKFSKEQFKKKITALVKKSFD